jgi:hypothetical protein
MRHRWPAETVFTRDVLLSEDRACPQCARDMFICDHRRHPIYSLQGPRELICKLLRCPDSSCPAHAHTVSPPQELAIAPKGWLIGWDVFAFIGHRRCCRHWSVPDIRNELLDSYKIPLSDDAISVYIDRYQTLLAARHQDPRLLADDYRDINELVLSIDGLQPEKGHETLYVVRELNARRVWFAVPLLSSSADEVRGVLAQARQWAEALGKPVRLWMSDKQDAFVKGIAAEFQGVPHRYCANHFVRGLAKPVLDADSNAKVQMRKHVRGLRAIERQVLDGRRETQPLASQAVAAAEPVGVVEVCGAGPAAIEEAAGEAVAALAAGGGVGACTAPAPAPPAAAADEAAEVVLGYCAAVRGILNDDQGGPEHPPGLRMAEVLGEVQESLGRVLAVEGKKGGVPISN